MRDIFSVFQTDLLPHNRGRGCDPRNVFETAGGKCFHQFFFRIGIPDEVYKCRSNDVRQMADRSGYAVVLPVVEDNRQRF